jgi:hypothetical protein
MEAEPSELAAKARSGPPAALLPGALQRENGWRIHCALRAANFACLSDLRALLGDSRALARKNRFQTGLDPTTSSKSICLFAT